MGKGRLGSLHARIAGALGAALLLTLTLTAERCKSTDGPKTHPVRVGEAGFSPRNIDVLQGDSVRYQVTYPADAATMILCIDKNIIFGESQYEFVEGETEKTLEVRAEVPDGTVFRTWAWFDASDCGGTPVIEGGGTVGPGRP